MTNEVPIGSGDLNLPCVPSGVGRIGDEVELSRTMSDGGGAGEGGSIADVQRSGQVLLFPDVFVRGEIDDVYDRKGGFGGGRAG